MESFRDQYELRRGKITLYRRTSQGSKYQSDNWNARFNIPGEKAIRRSLKTTNQDEAELRAEDLYQELLSKSKKGMSLKTKRFGLVCDAFVRHLTEQRSHEAARSGADQKLIPKTYKSKIDITENYIKPLLGDKTLDSITDFDIEEFVDKRRMFHITGPASLSDTHTYIRNGRKVTTKKNPKIPSHSTLNKDLTVLRQIFEFARTRREVDSKQIPTIKNISRPKNYVDRKPDLSRTEYQSLIKKLEWKIKNQTNPKHKRSHILLYNYILILANTGMRVTEAKNMKFRDCQEFKNYDGERYVQIHVSGKGKSRDLIAMPNTEIYLNRLRELHQENAKQFGWKFDESMNVFLNDHGQPVGSFKKALDAILDDCGLLHDSHGAKRSAGAFRKYYITSRLTKGGVNPFDLAKNCGTSLEVIQKYYENLQPKYVAKELTRPRRDL